MRSVRLLKDWTSAAFSRRRSLFSKSVAAWASVAALLFIASAQPTAQALDFPMTTRLTLPDSADLVAQPSTTVALFSQFKSTVTISANELALVSITSTHVESARHPKGAQIVARNIMESKYGWTGKQFGCLKSLWARESHWNYKAHNSRSGAHGIAQAHPAIKMNMISTDWKTNPITQIRWGLHYIESRYSTPCNAWLRFQRHHSY
jgi:hypothetical protein